jgi:hypothetical protein
MKEFEYDEEAAVKFIQNHLPQELKKKFEDDTIYYMLDVICDFYEQNDYFDNDDEEKEEKELIAYIITQAKEQEMGDFADDEIRLFLKAEEAYTDTLDIFE